MCGGGVSRRELRRWDCWRRREASVACKWFVSGCGDLDGGWGALLREGGWDCGADLEATYGGSGSSCGAGGRGRGLRM